MQLVTRLDDQSLLSKVRQSLSDEREAMATFLGLLIMVEDRRLYAEAGYASLFAFCTQDLGLKEAETYRRIRAARLAREFPTVIDRIASGALCLSAIKHIGPYLTELNARVVLDRVSSLTTRETERYARELEAALRPPTSLPPEPAVVSNSDAPQLTLGSALNPPHVSPVTAERLAAAARPDKTRFLTPDRIEIRFVADEALLKKIDRVKGLAMRRGVSAMLEDIFDHVIETYLDKFDPERWEKKKTRRTKVRQNPSRYIPMVIKRDVQLRDGGQCTFIGPDGKRCACTAGLEFDHIVPFALGGSSTDVNNIRLRCRAHNRLAAEQAFGKDHIAAKIEPNRTDGPVT